ncbi:MAG TPA: alpha/beta hydrolase [Afifellaceae bacterium]|nr:alpha/beta hydrolase [Afifellaceae bacterium]
MTTLPLLADLPENPVPRGTVSGEIFTDDKVRIRYARWAATSRRKRGTILLLHGRSEFVEKYFETANDLRRRGFAAVTFDWRGQGGSQRFLRDRNKGHVDSFMEYVRDLDAVMKQVVLADCPPPYFILGHSTGSAVALLYARRARTQIERMVLMAPLLGLAGKSRRVLLFTTGLAQFFGFGESYVPGGGRTLVQTEPFEGNPVTSDRQRHDRTSAVIAARPDLGLGSPTVSWVHAAMRTAESFESPDFPESVPMPVLMVMAGRESLVSNKAIEHLSSRMKTGAHTLIPGARHEILSEADVYRDQFWAAFDSFVG